MLKMKIFLKFLQEIWCIFIIPRRTCLAWSAAILTFREVVRKLDNLSFLLTLESLIIVLNYYLFLEISSNRTSLFQSELLLIFELFFFRMIISNWIFIHKIMVLLMLRYFFLFRIWTIAPLFESNVKQVLEKTSAKLLLLNSWRTQWAKVQLKSNVDF